MSSSTSTGILIRGKISEWTRNIIHEYEQNFPNTTIVLSTWDTENVDNVSCIVIQSKEPEIPKPHKLTVNHQILAVREGLKHMSKCDIILNCRTDQVIHNRNIFEIFQTACSENKIMIPSLGTNFPDYYIVDYCQVAKRNLLIDYWNNVPLYDGSYSISAELYIPKFYVNNVKKDPRSWKITQNEYFCIKGLHEHFKLEWEKLSTNEFYQRDYKNDKSNNSMLYDNYIELINN